MTGDQGHGDGAPAPAVRLVDVRTPDGRVLRVHDAGHAGDQRVPVIVHHGTPLSGALPPPALRDAGARGLRLVGYDRPGYGGSDRRSDRSVADVVGDVVSVADELGFDRFLTWGASGGGPHAVAVAAMLPGRVAAAACVAGVAPYGAAGLDWTAGMGQENVDEFGAGLQGPEALSRYLTTAREELLAATPATIAEAMRSLLPPVDVAALDTDLGPWLHESMVAGVRPGWEGWLDDDLAFLRDWGVDLDALSVPVLVVAGGQDLMVPFAHGTWLAERLPGAATLLDDDAGHLSLLARIGEVHAWLLDRWHESA